MVQHGCMSHVTVLTTSESNQDNSTDCRETYSIRMKTRIYDIHTKINSKKSSSQPSRVLLNVFKNCLNFMNLT
jgi:hypothetical protein